MMPLALLPLVGRFASAMSQAGCVASQQRKFLGLETWYRFLTVKFDPISNSCTITNFNAQGNTQNVFGAHSPLLLVGLAVVDDLLRIAGLLAVGYVIYGAIQYIISQGNPDATGKAQQTIVNALIGVALSVVAVGIVSFIGGQLGG